MKLSHFFIDRPIFAAVLSIFTIVIGAIAYFTLPVAQYPDVVPPTIVVRASYPGAPPEIIADTVATPIEQEVNGVEDMLYMSSQCTTDGQMVLTITFRVGTDLDTAQVLVQNRVSVAEPRLPEEVRRLGVVTAKASPDILLVIHLLSPGGEYDQSYIGNFAMIRVRDVLARVEGVGDVILFGLREYSMRVWLDPERLAHLDLTPGDVVAALREQNTQVASGVIGQPPAPVGVAFQLPINTLGRLVEPSQFEEVVLKTGPGGQVTRVRDVARIELGARDYSVSSYLNNEPAVAIVIAQRPGSNAVATSAAVERTMEELSREFPQGLEHRIVYNPTVFVRESINAVLHTVLEAVGLVVIVVLVFLQSWRASLIPLLAIPVSLIGTFAALAAFGFSLNMLSLFGLVLAIGIVVDDAIVVVENVERHIAAGLSPRDAARKAMEEVTRAVIAIAFGLSAVFVPTAFLGGITGQFYRQFALTIAVSTLLSAFNSLTLSPALCALLLQPHGARKDWFGRLWDRAFGWFFRAFNRGFEKTSDGYARAVGWIVRRAAIGLILYAALMAFGYYEFRVVPAGFIPAQDKAYLIVSIQLPDGASLERTEKVVRRATETILSTPGVQYAVAFAGFSGATRANSSNAAAIFVGPRPFEERVKHGPSIWELLGSLQGRLGEIQEAEIYVIPPPPVQGLGTSGGFKLIVQDRSGQGFPALQDAADRLAGAAMQDPSVTGIFSSFRASTPQLFADIDRVKVNKLNVPLANIFDVLQVYLGSVYVNDFNLFGRTFQVRAHADAAFRADPEDIFRLKTRNASGGMVPLGSVLNITRRSGPDRVLRYNMYPGAEINGDAARGYSSGDAVTTMERLATQVLPSGMGIEWTDLAFQQKLAGNAALFIFPLCILFVFLVHSAEYESWALPLAVILIAPLCLPFALAGVWLRGMENDLITQIGFVVLIGLAAKNAVLIVEFAKQEEDAGKDRFSAAVEACRLRLRPILMTSFAFILGVFPLVRAQGAGSEMRRSLGTAVFSGMLGVTILGLILTPVFYVVLRAAATRRAARKARAAAGAAAPVVLSIALLPLLLGGCAIAGRDYERPPTPVRESFVNDLTPPGDAGPIESAWWKTFGDPELVRLIEIAVAQNHDVRIASARLREARELRFQTELDILPTVTSGAGYTTQRLSETALPPGGGFDRDREIYDAGFDALWELDLFGRVRRAIEASLAEEEAEEELLRDVLVSVQAEVGRNYFELRGAENRLAVARRNAENQRQTFDLTVARLEGGRGTELDTSRSRAQLHSTLAALPLLEAAIERSRHRLAVLTGRQPGELELPSVPAAGLPALPAIVPAGTPADLLRRRPDVRSAERLLAAATAREGVAAGDLYPRVTLIGSIGLEAGKLADLGSSGSETYSFGPRIFWPAFDLARVAARVRAAGERAEAALAAYERSALTALEETENSLVDYDRLRRSVGDFRIAAEASEEASRLAHERYEFGVSDFLVVLDAQRTVLESQDRLADGETRAATALVALYKALGGGWQAVEPEPLTAAPPGS